MRDNQQEPTFEFQDWFDGGDIFYRSKDKQRFQLALDAIVDDDLGLAVIGTNETVLDHYCRILVARLRDLGIFQLEIFLPTNTDSLLKRFNEMLATMSMEQARQPADPATPVKLLVVNDAKAVNEEQWSLLVRLLSDFPGVNVRLVLFLDKTGWPNYEKPLTLFGRRLYRWVVETPTLDEASQLMKAAVEHGFEKETETLLMHTGLGAAIRGGYSDEDPEEYVSPLLGDDGDHYVGEDYSDNNPFPPQNIDFPELDDALDQDSDDSDEDQGNSSGRSKAWAMVLAFIFSLVATWLVVSKINPEMAGQYSDRAAEGFKALTFGSESPAAKQPEQAPQSTLAVESPAPEKPNRAEETKAVMAALKQEREANMPVTQPVTKPPAVEKPAAKKPIDEKPATPVPKVISPSERWVTKVKNANSSDFFVQHIVLSERAEAIAYIKRYSSIKAAMVLEIKIADKLSYAVVSGPFVSRNSAQSFAKEPGRPADYWIRRAPELAAAISNN
jgi:hypothetical protein